VPGECTVCQQPLRVQGDGYCDWCAHIDKYGSLTEQALSQAWRNEAIFKRCQGAVEYFQKFGKVKPQRALEQLAGRYPKLADSDADKYGAQQSALTKGQNFHLPKPPPKDNRSIVKQIVNAPSDAAKSVAQSVSKAVLSLPQIVPLKNIEAPRSPRCRRWQSSCRNFNG